MEKDKISKIANHYGLFNQSRQLIEEMAELMVALNKYIRILDNHRDIPSEWLDLSDAHRNIVEEIADVLVMLEQIKVLLFIEDLNIEKIANSKLDRQLERMKKE